MKESQQARFRREYPTLEAFDKVKAGRTQKAFAEFLGVSNNIIYNHDRWLANGSPPIVKKEKQAKLKRNGELDKKVIEMCGSGYAEVKVYRMTDEFKPGQIGPEGLEYIRTDVSPTALSLWRRGGE